MPSERHIKLEIPGTNLINCFGIQPVLFQGEVPQRISLFSLQRYTKWRDNATTNNIFYVPKIYKGLSAKNIYDKSISANLSELYVLNLLLQNSLHIRVQYTLDELQNDKVKLKNLLLYYSELLKYKNRMNKGNFFITSDNKIFNNIKFAAKQLNNYKKYKIESSYLEENLIIIGAKGYVNFDNPIIAVPFINSNDYNTFIKDRINFQINQSSSWPVMSYMRKEYDNYQLFLNEKMPLKWHFEIFNYPEMFYITLHLK